MLCLLRYPDPYMSMFAEQLDKFQRAPIYDVILDFMDDYVKKCLSTHPDQAYELPPASGWFDYGGDPTNSDQYYQRGWDAAHTKNQPGGGVHRGVQKRVASHEAGTLGVPPDDEYEVQYTWRTLQASKDPECFPKIFISRVAQREYIDVLCSFSLRFLYYVLRMSQDDGRKMIVRTFHPIRGLQR
ncbi:hypothetical protein DL771_011694 [Monosporascus sp. 5C6A]|nr:hypothetical protein DL771_011694 [Monosporascus sp. 5C6A]